MCAISGSFDPVKLKELYKLNAYRGEHSHSMCSFTPYKSGYIELCTLMQDEGPMSDELFEFAVSLPDRFYITHSQAPTGQTGHMHPAAYGDCMLWHNGIIKQKSLPENTWDTLWMLENITNYGWSSLSRIDGTFACIMYNSGEMFAFRNEISPLFIDENLNISSTKFEGAKPLEPNIVWKLSLVDKSLTAVAYFDTFENPYYFGDAA
jgi:hypothetical protein